MRHLGGTLDVEKKNITQYPSVQLASIRGSGGAYKIHISPLSVRPRV
jgi:hypothetical protein